MKNWKEIRSFVSYAWTFLATAVALVLGVRTYTDSAAIGRLDAREKLDSLMSEVRANYLLYCDEQTEMLRPIRQASFESLVEVAAVDPQSPPYDQPCLAPPGATTATYSYSVSPSKLAPRYKDWGVFATSGNKKALLWIEDVPLAMDIASIDWSVLETSYRDLGKQLADCTREEQSKVEHTFMQLNCQWALDDDNNIALSRIEIK